MTKRVEKERNRHTIMWEEEEEARGEYGKRRDEGKKKQKMEEMEDKTWEDEGVGVERIEERGEGRERREQGRRKGRKRKGETWEDSILPRGTERDERWKEGKKRTGIEQGT